MNATQQHLGEIVAGHRLGRDTMILLGWSGEDMPAQGTAVLRNRRNGKGRFTAFSVTDDQQRHWFLMIIHGPEAGLSQNGDGFQLRDGAGVATTAYAPPAILEAEFFAAEVVTRLGVRSGDAARFLAKLFSAMTPVPEAAGALLEALHLSDGQPAGARFNIPGRKVARAVSHTRFTGQDTVSGLTLPVRMAVDLCARAPGTGWYVTGWLLDPLKLVSAVWLRGPEGADKRLDTTWTRLPREDVSSGFRNESLFEGRIGDDRHGFAVFVADSAIESQAWIELELGSHGCAFMPTAVVTATSMTERKRLLTTVDLCKPSATEIIERQLGPLFHAHGEAPKPQVGHRVLYEAAAPGRTALIVPMTDDSIKSSIVVSHLAGCRIPSDVQVTFVCSPTVTDVLRRLPRDLEFYGVAANVLVTDEAVDSCEALEIGAEACDADNLVFLSPRAHALKADWLDDLVATLGDGSRPVVVSPTLLYEDSSVRYAGIDAVEFSAVSPYANVVCGRAGYPRGALPSVQTEATFCGAIDCCAMTRTAFDAVGGFSQGYALDLVKGTDLFLRMGAAGVSIKWMGTVELYALDDLQANTEHSAQVGIQVDGWSFRAAWQDKAIVRAEEAGPTIAPSHGRASASHRPIRRAAAE